MRIAIAVLVTLIFGASALMRFTRKPADKVPSDLAVLERDRVIRLQGELGEGQATQVIARLLFLEDSDRRRPIRLEIDSAGGDMTSGLAVADTMNDLAAPVHTRCTGMAAGPAALILVTGAPGERVIEEHAKVAFGQVVDSEAVSGTKKDPLAEYKRRFCALTCQKMEAIEAGFAGNKTFTATEAVEFRWADRVEAR